MFLRRSGELQHTECVELHFVFEDKQDAWEYNTIPLYLEEVFGSYPNCRIIKAKTSADIVSREIHP